MIDIGFALANFDFLAVGIAASAIALLGFAVYFNDRANSTGRNFLFFALMTVLWSSSNFLQYQFTTIDITLLAMRINLFLATWHAFSLFQFSYVFPESKGRYPSWYRRILIPAVAAVSILTLTPFVFSGIGHLAPHGEVTNPSRGVGIVFFGLATIGLLASGIVCIYRKARATSETMKRRQILSVFFGVCITTILIIVLSMFLPIFLSDLTYLPFSAFFFLPFIGLIFYGIYRFRLFNLKVIAVQTFTFVLGVLMFVEVLGTKDFLALFYRTSLLIAIIAAGILLTRSVTREVRQRELIEKQEKELEDTNARLRELDKQKSEFLSFASHQLRTPLTAIKWSVGSIMDGSYGDVPEHLREPLRAILEESSSMAVMINDYLNVSRIEQGRMQYQFAPIDLGALLRTVADELRHGVEEKGLSLSVEAPSERVMVWGDAGKLTQVFGNIVDNAMKYTPKGSIALSLRAEAARGTAHVEIRDTGIGMNEATRRKIFEKFIRGDNAQEVNSGGSGLGLFIVKTFVEAHKGAIWPESAGEGAGTVFYIELPLLVQK